jgi:hypothetical protein
MPHDQFGKPLQPGDVVNIPCVIKSISSEEGYCNVELETLHGRRPDGHKDTFSALNTAQVEKVG